MISLEQVYSYYPNLEKTQELKRYMLREYLQFMILDFLSTCPFVNRIILSGGSALRFKYGLDRFTKDLFFNYIDCSQHDFIKMTDSVISFLGKVGIEVESRDKDFSSQSLFKRYLYFPKFLFSIKLSVFDEKRFFASIGVVSNKLMQGATIKAELEKKGFEHKQGLGYENNFDAIEGCGFSFLFPMPSLSTLFSMKLAALILRQNGRDFYDVLFLQKIAKPDYNFLKHRVGASNEAELHTKIIEALKHADLVGKSRDVEHLVFDEQNLERVKNFWNLLKFG